MLAVARRAGEALAAAAGRRGGSDPRDPYTLVGDRVPHRPDRSAPRDRPVFVGAMRSPGGARPRTVPRNFLQRAAAGLGARGARGRVPWCAIERRGPRRALGPEARQRARFGVPRHQRRGPLGRVTLRSVELSAAAASRLHGRAARRALVARGARHRSTPASAACGASRPCSEAIGVDGDSVRRGLRERQRAGQRRWAAYAPRSSVGLPVVVATRGARRVDPVQLRLARRRRRATPSSERCGRRGRSSAGRAQGLLLMVLSRPGAGRGGGRPRVRSGGRNIPLTPERAASRLRTS